MQIDRRITNGLAWAGALLIVGVPAADMLSSQFLGDKVDSPAAQIAVVTPQEIAPTPAPASQRPAPKPVEVAAIKPADAAPAAVKPRSMDKDAVDKFAQSGKPLPSYITDVPAKPTQTASIKPVPAAIPAPAPVQPAAPAAPQNVAVIPAPAAPQQNVAAVTTPAVPPIAAQPALPAPLTDPFQTASIAPKVAPIPMPLSMRPRPVAVATVNQPTGFPANEPVFVPPSVQPVPPAELTAEDLDDWETGPLADFLARRQGQQQAQVAPSADDDYYYDRGQQFQRRDRLVGPELFYQP